jgi:hypothetical protein
MVGRVNDMAMNRLNPAEKPGGAQSAADHFCQGAV